MEFKDQLKLRIEFKDKVKIDDSIFNTIIEFTKEPDRIAILSDSDHKAISWYSSETRDLKGQYDKVLAIKIKTYEL
jgi:hypothetical protein